MCASNNHWSPCSPLLNQFWHPYVAQFPKFWKVVNPFAKCNNYIPELWNGSRRDQVNPSSDECDSLYERSVDSPSLFSKLLLPIDPFQFNWSIGVTVGAFQLFRFNYTTTTGIIYRVSHRFHTKEGLILKNRKYPSHFQKKISEIKQCRSNPSLQTIKESHAFACKELWKLNRVHFRQSLRINCHWSYFLSIFYCWHWTETFASPHYTVRSDRVDRVWQDFENGRIPKGGTN